MKATKITVISSLAVAAIVMAYFCIMSVVTPIQFEETRIERESAVISNLVDLRTAELEYHHQKGCFTASYDTLLHFLKNAPKKELLKEGSFTNRNLSCWIYTNFSIHQSYCTNYSNYCNT